MSSDITQNPVVIVGGGVAGLVCAHILLEQGIEVVIIERLETLGGLARSFVYENGFVFDCGPHRFDVTNPNVRAYVERILEQNHTYFPRKSEVYFKEKYYGWPIKLQNLVQLPKDIALKALLDLAVNGFKKYGEDNFQNYILRQYGPTLYKHFFEGYSVKFLGIHPNITHSDWAKVGINRAIINDNAQMQNLFQLLKSTFLQVNQAPQKFVYPKGGMQDAWDSVAEKVRALGGTIITGAEAQLEHQDGRIVSVSAAGRTFQPSKVVWTAPINVACKQLDIKGPDLKYLGLLLFNVMVKEEAPRDYQWCYYGATDLIFNRISTPKFLSPYTCPTPDTVGYCCEVTCMVGDEKWRHGERLTDWIIDDLLKVGMLKDRNSVIDVRLERLPNSYPVYTSNYPQELALARESLSKFENLVLAGRTGLFWYNNMDHSIENAMQLSRKLLREAGTHTQESHLASGLTA